MTEEPLLAALYPTVSWGCTGSLDAIKWHMTSPLDVNGIWISEREATARSRLAAGKACSSWQRLLLEATMPTRPSTWSKSWSAPCRDASFKNPVCLHKKTAVAASCPVLVGKWCHLCHAVITQHSQKTLASSPGFLSFALARSQSLLESLRALSPHLQNPHLQKSTKLNLSKLPYILQQKLFKINYFT